ncbi:uncharacterized protein LOC121374242 isoform X2 [Gigantopelta aegis]|uniref:uncharacterized protein LOC121374242 isoform X2 n=1 Tax=Gigantopelta aegis TaxID=1735272 RepID=UPI001B88E3D3|nr:uncharacterized protein LOC121374242 isoform X2 [Gigantopelta aegis]
MTECFISELMTKDNLDIDNNIMDPSQQSIFVKTSTDEMVLSFNILKGIDRNDKIEQNMVLQHNMTEEIENLSQKLSQTSVALDEDDLSGINDKPVESLSVTNEWYESSQSEVNSPSLKTNTCFQISQNDGTSFPKLSSHPTFSAPHPLLLHSEPQKSECQILTVNGVDTKHSDNDFINEEEAKCAVIQNTLLHCTYEIVRNEFSNLVESHNVEVFKNFPCDKASDDLVQFDNDNFSEKIDKNNSHENCAEEFAVNITINGSDNTDAYVQVDDLQLQFSQCSEHNEVKKTEVDSTAAPLYIQDFVPLETKMVVQDSADIPKENIYDGESTFVRVVDECHKKITDCVIPESCSYSVLITKNNGDHAENIMVPLQQSTLIKASIDETVSLFKIQDVDNHKWSRKIEKDERNKVLKNNVESEHLSRKLCQTLFAQDKKSLCDKDEKIMMSLPVSNESHKPDQSGVNPPSRNTNSHFQSSQNDRTGQSKALFSDLSQPAHSAFSVAHQHLLNFESKMSEVQCMIVTGDGTEYRDNDTNDNWTRHAVIQDMFLSDEQNIYNVTSNEIFQKDLKHENLFYAVDSESSATNDVTTMNSLVGYKTSTECSAVVQTNNIPFDHNQNNRSKSPNAQNIDICSSGDFQIETTVSDTLKHILIQCDKILNGSFMNQDMEIQSKSSENMFSSLENLSVFSTKQNRFLVPKTELAHKSPNVLFVEHDDLKSTIIKTKVDEEYSNELKQNEEIVLPSKNSNDPSTATNLETLVDNSPDINISISGGKEQLVLAQKLRPEIGCQKSNTLLVMKDAESEIETSEMEENLVPCFNSVSKDQLVPEEEVGIEMTSDCTFYEKDGYQYNLKDVPLKNSKDFSTTQCFKWRYTPSLGLSSDVPEELPKFEGFADNLRKLPILRTCSRPIRIGLSRKQRAGRLHSIPGNK